MFKQWCIQSKQKRETAEEDDLKTSEDEIKMF